jgi:hypothetical protein
MSSTARKPIDFGSLDDFDVAPATSKPSTASTRKAIDEIAAFPSREVGEDSQMNIKATAEVLDRFRRMAKADRYKHGEFLQILMDAYTKE